MITPGSHLLVPTDFSPASETAFETARQLASQTGGKVTLAYVARHEPLGPGALEQADEHIQRAEALAHEQLDRLAEAHFEGVEVKTALVRDTNAALALAELAAQEGCDLIVVASHGRTGLKRLLIGSVAETIVRQARCPVLVLRAPRDHS